MRFSAVCRGTALVLVRTHPRRAILGRAAPRARGAPLPASAWRAGLAPPLPAGRSPACEAGARARQGNAHREVLLQDICPLAGALSGCAFASGPRSRLWKLLPPPAIVVCNCDALQFGPPGKARPSAPRRAHSGDKQPSVSGRGGTQRSNFSADSPVPDLASRRITHAPAALEAGPLGRGAPT